MRPCGQKKLWVKIQWAESLKTNYQNGLEKRTVNPSHLCTQQTATTDDIKPHSVGSQKGRVQHSTVSFKEPWGSNEKPWSSNCLPQSGWVLWRQESPLSGSQRLHSVKWLLTSCLAPTFIRALRSYVPMILLLRGTQGPPVEGRADEHQPPNELLHWALLQ